MNLLCHVQLKNKIQLHSKENKSSILIETSRCHPIPLSARVLSRLARPMYLHAGDSDAEAVQFYNTRIKVWLLGQLLMEIFLAPASF